MKISISIVTYNSMEDIDGVLESIQNCDCFADIELFVIDNASTDGTAEHVKQKYPFAKVISSQTNGGYGHGHNQALPHLSSDVHFVINPDIRFEKDILSQTARFLLDSEDVALCTPEMFTEDGKYVYPPKAQPRLHYIAARFLGRLKCLQKWRDAYVMADQVRHNDGAPFDIGFCSGAFMAIKTKYLQEVKGFDDRYFLYYEDADLTRKLLKYGRCVCIPKLSIIHEGKRAAYRSREMRKIMIRSMIRYFGKWGWKL